MQPAYILKCVWEQCPVLEASFLPPTLFYIYLNVEIPVIACI